MLDPGKPNSVSTEASKKTNDLASSDTTISNGLFASVLAHPGTLQAFYCLEHQIGGTIPWALDPFDRRRTIAQVGNLTWIRFYAVSQITQVIMNLERIWDINSLANSFTVERYAHAAGTGAWYGQPPTWSVSVNSYDSKEVQRFQGQNHQQRVADIQNSAMWRKFLTESLPTATGEIAKNNQLRIELRLANDVIGAINATTVVQTRVQEGFIAAEEAPA
jgi:hypothetical protein